MKRNAGIVLIVVAIALGVWGFMQHEEKEADVKIGDVEIGVDKGKDYPVTVFVLAGVALVGGLVLMNGKKV
jgi:hypothetical protein